MIPNVTLPESTPYVNSDSELQIPQKTVEIEFDKNAELNSTSFKVCGKDFTVLKLAGTGSYGKVYKVLKMGGIDDDRVFAMKVVQKAAVTKNVKDTAHTKSERSVLASSRHPFIVDLIYCFQTPANLYFVMEFCFGGEIFQLLENLTRLPLEAVRFYVAEITLALEYLHRLCVVYRDLKPENIMLDAEGHVKLTDFGMSKENITSNCLTYTFCGTVDYMAPEILMKCGHGIPVDWWTLGAVSFDMLIGQPPFAHKSREVTIRQIIYDELEFPSLVKCPHFISLLRGLLAKDPKLRFSVDEVKNHPFFGVYEWEDVYCKRLSPPFSCPAIKNYKTRQGNVGNLTISDLEEAGSFPAGQGSDEFKGFSYVADSLLTNTVQGGDSGDEAGLETDSKLSSTDSFGLGDLDLS